MPAAAPRDPLDTDEADPLQVPKNENETASAAPLEGIASGLYLRTGPRHSKVAGGVEEIARLGRVRHNLVTSRPTPTSPTEFEVLPGRLQRHHLQSLPLQGERCRRRVRSRRSPVSCGRRWDKRV